MKIHAKALVGSVAAGALLAASAAPALARDGRHDNGISAGDVIAGALVIGGIAAVAAAASNDRGRDYDGRGYDGPGYDGRSYDGRAYGYGGNDGRWNNGGYDRAYAGDPRMAVEYCVRAAERNAARVSYGRADVTDVRDIRQTRWGYEVRGRIAVNTSGRDWRRGDGDYGRGWNGDYRGWNSGLRGYDSGSFSCRVERGRIVDLDYRGIRGL